ncbi:hypothetical protein LOTGIDRAFT_236975 [Lottia gigantea]|uniref:EGF-like domain-containing protein n=1 Tax=Lottia gigantea TaxID=225164 RepID=V4B2D1_LOTGI|nr:hypothetical protein LOTGIDRAFT_236975 [Lottia gigantea]ESO82484.1 hypothetical protein LOTGIDRAFT_236975 [Lottia gigantea]
MSTTEFSMNLRISLLIAAYFVNVFADQSKWIIHDEVNSLKDDVEFMSQELLIPVKTKTIAKSKPVKVTSPLKPHIDQSKPELVQSSKNIDNTNEKRQSPPSLEDEFSSKELLPVKSKQTIPPNPVKPKSVSNPKAKQSLTKTTVNQPCKEKDVKCLLAKENLLLAITPKSLGAGRPESVIDNHYINSATHNNELSTQQANSHIQESEEEESDDDILRSISDESINRYRRQVAPSDGGSGAGFFEESTTTNENPEFSIELAITLEDSDTDGSLTDAEKLKLRTDFETELTKRFSFMPGFKYIKVSTDDITLDSKNRPQAKFDIVLDGNTIGALGSNPEERKENYTTTLRQAGDVFSSTDEISGSKTLPIDIKVDDFITKLDILLSDVCESDQPCDPGYICSPGKTTTGEYEGSCVHACYASKLNELCQNGAICTLDGDNQPYCQCGTKNSGVFCEKEEPVTSGELSTAEVVGITVGTLLAIAALASCFFFIVFCRKRSEKDMEYSYYGDDDNLMQGYLDQSSNLGISNMYIDRPRISIQPLDIYNDPAMGTHA